MAFKKFVEVWPRQHSSTICGYSIPVAQLGPVFLLLDALADHPPGPASILLRVDQSEQRWDVRLPNGISAASKRVAITACV